MTIEVQCFDGDGEPPPSERLVRISCHDILWKEDFGPPGDDEGTVEFRLDFSNERCRAERVAKLDAVANEKCCFLLYSGTKCYQLVDAYFLGHRNPSSWSIVAKFSRPKQVFQMVLREY